MTLDLQNALVYAHRANIDRYRKLLKTYLTDHERKFLERRLGEEKAAFLQIAQRPVSFDCPDAG